MAKFTATASGPYSSISVLKRATSEGFAGLLAAVVGGGVSETEGFTSGSTGGMATPCPKPVLAGKQSGRPGEGGRGLRVVRNPGRELEGKAAI
ncbi:hypothetical protein GCM10012319_42990 [Comamonas sp. KCTC 72670]|nr:hypothetical protein GCM10012319_42990 [Comamonas sp. KCTC 72670]